MHVFLYNTHEYCSYNAIVKYSNARHSFHISNHQALGTFLNKLDPFYRAKNNAGASLYPVDAMRERLKNLQEFIKYDMALHMEEESGCLNHCLKHACGSDQSAERLGKFPKGCPPKCDHEHTTVSLKKQTSKKFRHAPTMVV